MSEKIKLEANEDDIKAIQEWLIAQPHLPDKLEEILIRRFLFACKQNLQVTKNTIDIYFTIRHGCPDLFANRNPSSSEVQLAITVFDYLPLPNVTKNNYRAILTCFRDKNPDNFNYNGVIKTLFMLMDARARKELPLTEGDVAIIDCTGFTFKHLSKWVLSTARVYMKYTQEALPTKLRQVHIINCSSIVDKLFSVLRPMLKEEVRKYIFFHLPNSNTLYEHVPQKLLPNEYGGEAGHIDDIKMIWVDKLEEMRDFYLNEKQWKVDESRRPVTSKTKKIKDEFKSLSID